MGSSAPSIASGSVVSSGRDNDVVTVRGVVPAASAHGNFHVVTRFSLANVELSVAFSNLEYKEVITILSRNRH